ncbi:MAG TPA: succinate dehydrogenase cytochrome b subunit [Candidatus Hydrogenedentes bacterium]|nr:succinate dehydrogenase cytochrome b subunit [Candidatus Hydrogenedentota bacterium]HOL76955.1 succinate dehydrogenase cytochrome b subunit [Candidatus Hydrogenedentota bacterium]HPO86656.1 succinate dehydrogenase cytochrome b subunit [Candidatus Hydrogenedentota bacterium]
MRVNIFKYSSVGKKQIVAITGLMLVGFILVHLGGNFMLFGGPEKFNGYAEDLHRLGPILWAARAILLVAVSVHITLTFSLYLENRNARGTPYAVYADFGNTTFAKRTMILTGGLIFFFVVTHLSDFTFASKTGPRTVIPGVNGDASLGLFGLVWMSFLRPWRVVLYIGAVCMLGMHLSHGIQSFLQTLGINHSQWTPYIERVSNLIGVLVALGYSMIPLYVVIRHLTVGVGV